MNIKTTSVVYGGTPMSVCLDCQWRGWGECNCVQATESLDSDKVPGEPPTSQGASPGEDLVK